MKDIYDTEVSRADLVVGGLFPTVERYSAFDLTWPYFTDAISSYVIARLPVPHWHYPIAVLTPSMWAALFGLMALLAGVLRVTNGGSLQYYTLILWGVLTDGDPKPHLPRGPGRSVCFVFLWTVFCLHFNSGYRASLATASINPLTRPGPRGLDDVQRFGFVQDLATYLLRKEDRRPKKKGMMIEICQNIQNCSDEIKKDPENMAIITTQLSIWSVTPRYFLDENLLPLLRKTETLATFFVSFMVNKDSMLRVHVDHSLQWAIAHGIHVKALKDIDLVLQRELERMYRMKLRQHTFTDLSGALILLELGLLLALAVFLAELTHHRLQQRRMQTQHRDVTDPVPEPPVHEPIPGLEPDTPRNKVTSSLSSRPLYGYRHLLLAHGRIYDVLCREALASLHRGGQDVVLHTGWMDDIYHKALPRKIDLVVIFMKAHLNNVFEITMKASLALGAFKHLTPLLVVNTLSMRHDRADAAWYLHSMSRALRLTGWVHTAVALQHGEVSGYLALPRYAPGERCGFGPPIITPAFQWTESEPLVDEDVLFLRPPDRPALNGCVINVAPLFGPPFVYVNQNMFLHGLDIALLEYFAVDMNASLHYMPVTTASSVKERLTRWDRIRFAVEEHQDMNDIYDTEVSKADLVDSMLRVHVDHSLQRAIAHGIHLKALADINLLLRRELERMYRMKLRQHTFTDLSGAMILLELGLLLALAVFLAELTHHRLQQRRMRTHHRDVTDPVPEHPVHEPVPGLEPDTPRNKVTSSHSSV
ncbi:Esterase YjfP [Frankliniella fusca]|uniref:Esterase YjfP n=1 Tax=Frankliniella fusca TaxID=407009 RepID=A0AAE1LQX2_9NEOP|nr:Esterase YjfP [Frankliniella fusca]